MNTENTEKLVSNILADNRESFIDKEGKLTFLGTFALIALTVGVISYFFRNLNSN